MDYGLYLPNYFDKNAFDIPALCQNAKLTTTRMPHFYNITYFISNNYLLFLV